MALPKKTVLAATLGMALTPSVATAAGKFSADQYKKAAWMTTRFYGAMRAGLGPNWILQGTENPTSFVKDKDSKGRDITGSWFDCGDHVMFGQPQFFATYVLATSLENFPQGFDDSYAGDYSDYKASGDYSMAGGKPNGIQDLYEEIRYSADFITKITPDSNSFVSQIGDGKADHKKWVTAGKMATLVKADGGEADESRMIVENPLDAYTPSMAAAALAVVSRLENDPARAAKYLAHAKNAFGYALGKSGVQSDPTGEFYNYSYWGNARWQEGRFLAALELWRTTGDAQYKVLAEQNWSWESNDPTASGIYSRFEYANATGLARILAEKYLPNLTNKRLDSYLANYTGSVNSQGVTTWSAHNFVNRGPTGAAFLFALRSKLKGGASNDDFIHAQVDYLLGANSTNQAYVVGWDEKTLAGAQTKDVPAVHHRGYWGNENIAVADADFSDRKKPAPAKNKYLGGVIPGALDGSINTSVPSWDVNEVCLEQNAPLVGALGYIVSKLAPVDTSKFGTGTGNVARRAVQPLNVVRSGRSFEFRSPTGQALSGVKVLDASGREVWSDASGSASVRWSADRSGLYVVQAEAGSQRYAASVAIP